MTEEQTPKPYKVSVVDRETGGARRSTADGDTDTDVDTDTDSSRPKPTRR